MLYAPCGIAAGVTERAVAVDAEPRSPCFLSEMEEEIFELWRHIYAVPGIVGIGRESKKKVPRRCYVMRVLAPAGMHQGAGTWELPRRALFRQIRTPTDLGILQDTLEMSGSTPVHD